ncbi:cupin domain-containing protein [Bradyrhizobium sp. 179]|uniref:cupin domain-containing protein n=1 Tax=Bradyrhizobium sp. 179 TaxID=2782648 RepID=UPI001FFA16CA|nr:cupin domain-containing protein [Bradyrhizobium sp. 179]MCK1541144.1 cupin domain-containing protein [Bradyrhizobium sp. 179]
MTSRKPVVLRPSEIPARQRGGGAKTIPLVTRRTGSTSFINGITIFEPGAAIPLHKHNCEESVLLLEGTAVAEIDGVEYPIQAGDITFIPADIPHRFRNVSHSEGMKILWTYASVDATRTLIETGDTRSIDDEHKAAIVS